MATTVRDSFLSSVLAAPDDDTPRLIFADWLDDHGEPERAEFIRAQCELAKTPEFLPTECKVCGNTADETGTVEHGRGCYTQSEDGGGSSAADDNPRYEELRLRERELCPLTVEAFHRHGWPSDLPWPRFQPIFHRGFVKVITCPWPDCRDHLDAILKVQPVRRVVLTTNPRINFADVAGARIDFYNWPVLERLKVCWPGVEFELPTA